MPLRVVLTYRDAPGQPQFRSELSDWNLNPELASSIFQLSLPKDARQIPFAIQMRGPGSEAANSNGEVNP